MSVSMILISLILFVLMLYFPLIGILLILLSIPLPFEKSMFFSTIYPCDFVFIAVFAGWIVRAILKDRLELKGKRVLLIFLPLLVAGVVSGLNAIDRFRYVGYLYLWAQIPLACLMTASTIKNRKHLDIIVYTIFLATASISIFYVFSHVCDIAFNINKNILASYIGLAPPLILGAIFLRHKSRQKVPLFILAGVCLLGLVFTESRFGILSCGLSMLFLILSIMITDKEFKKYGKVVLLFVLLFCAVCFICASFFDIRLTYEFFRSEMENFSCRIELYQLGFGLFRQHPVIGIGLGNFLKHLIKTHSYPMSVHPHSMIVEILVETGLLGILATLVLLWNLARYLIEALKSCEGPHRYLVMGAIASLIFFFSHNIFDFTLGHGIGIQVGVILAIISYLF